MRIRYYLDPMSGIPHIYGHNVSEAEVEDVLSGAAYELTGKPLTAYRRRRRRKLQ